MCRQRHLAEKAKREEEKEAQRLEKQAEKEAQRIEKEKLRLEKEVQTYTPLPAGHIFLINILGKTFPAPKKASILILC